MDIGQRNDRIANPNSRGELIIPASHYAMITSNQNKLKLAIYGLGSCIALIIYINKKDIHAMSHIMLPDSKRGLSDPLNIPHKYVDSSVKELLKEFERFNVKKEDLKANIVGGSTINTDFEPILKNDIAIMKELKKYNIRIEKSHLGGSKGRCVIYDSKNNKIMLKVDGEDRYRQL